MIIENVWTIAPVAILDIPMETKKFLRVDEEGNESYLSIREYCAESTAQWTESNDGRYIMFGHEFSDLANDFGKAKSKATTLGLTLGGEDFLQTADGLVWVLSYSEVQEFLKVNPMFKQDEVA